MTQRPRVINWVLTRPGGACAATLSLQPTSGVIRVIRGWTTTHLQSYSNEPGKQRVIPAALYLGWVCDPMQAAADHNSNQRDPDDDSHHPSNCWAVCLGGAENGCIWACTPICAYMCVCAPQHLCRMITILILCMYECARLRADKDSSLIWAYNVKSPKLPIYNIYDHEILLKALEKKCTLHRELFFKTTVSKYTRTILLLLKISPQSTF